MADRSNSPRTEEAIHDAIRWAQANDDQEMVGRLVAIAGVLTPGLDRTGQDCDRSG